MGRKTKFWSVWPQKKQKWAFFLENEIQILSMDRRDSLGKKGEIYGYKNPIFQLLF